MSDEHVSGEHLHADYIQFLRSLTRAQIGVLLAEIRPAVEAGEFGHPTEALRAVLEAELWRREGLAP